MRLVSIRRALAAAALVAVAAAAHAMPRYTITELGALPGAVTCDALAVHAGGAAVGYCARSSNGFDQHAVAWAGGVATDLGLFPKGHYTVARGVNAGGVVVGDADFGDWTPRAFVFANGVLGPIDATSGAQIQAAGINDAGVIVGYMTKSGSGNPSKFRTVVWTADPKKPRRYVRTVLPVPAGGDPTQATAIGFAINGAGDVVGYGFSTVLGQRAVLWRGDAAHTLVVLPGEWTSIATGLNDVGQVVGGGIGADGLQHAVLWQNDTAMTPVDLGVLPGEAGAMASAVNDAGQVVGVSGTNGATRAFYAEAGTMVDLSTLLDASGADWSLATAESIDASGRIVGTGMHAGQQRAYLLTPLP